MESPPSPPPTPFSTHPQNCSEIFWGNSDPGNEVVCPPGLRRMEMFKFWRPLSEIFISFVFQIRSAPHEIMPHITV